MGTLKVFLSYAAAVVCVLLLVDQQGKDHPRRPTWSSLADKFESFAADTVAAFKGVQTELTTLRLTAIQNRMVLDQLSVSSGGVCVLIGSSCCTYIPAEDSDGGAITLALRFPQLWPCPTVWPVFMALRYRMAAIPAEAPYSCVNYVVFGMFIYFMCDTLSQIYDS